MRFKISCSWFLTAVFIGLFQGLPYAKALHVIVDPGHGGLDGGATHNNVRESNITLSISKKLFSLLKEDANFQATITRTKDQVTPLFERSRIAIENKGDVFISIHANSSPDLSARGAEFFFQSQMPADEEILFLANRENDNTIFLQMNIPKGDVAAIVDDIRRTQNIYSSQILAETFIEHWRKKKTVREEPIKQGPFHVLVNIPMPSVLIEVGFVTNARELKDLTDEKEQQVIAEIIYKGLKDYKEKIDKSQFSRHIINHANR